MENQSNFKSTRNYREVPPLNYIKAYLGIPQNARLMGWYINNPSNPLHFIDKSVDTNTILTQKLISCQIGVAKVFKLGEYLKAVDFVDSLKFEATVSAVFTYVLESKELPADTLNKALIDPNSTEYLMFSMLPLYDNKKVSLEAIKRA